MFSDKALPLLQSSPPLEINLCFPAVIPQFGGLILFLGLTAVC